MNSVAERDEKPAKLRAIIELHADPFEASLVRAHESHDGLGIDGSQAIRNFQRGGCADRELHIAAD